MRGNRVVLTVLVLFGTALVCSSVWSQPGRGGMGRRGGRGSDPYRLIQVEQVQKEIELLDDQKAKLKEVAEKTSALRREMFAAMQDLNREQRREKMGELREKMEAQTKDLRAQVEKILMPNQIARLKEINIQVQGLRALSNPEVVEALKITDAQQKELEEVRSRNSEDFRSLYSGIRDLSDEERTKKMAEIREKMSKRRETQEADMLKVLTSKQQKQFEEMKGEKFELDRSDLFRRGGRRGGRRPGGGDRPARPGN